MSTGLDETDRERLEMILDLNRSLGSGGGEKRSDNLTLGESSIEPDDMVYVAGTWNTTDSKFHLDPGCHHLRTKRREIRANTLHEEWTMCWWCQEHAYDE